MSASAAGLSLGGHPGSYLKYDVKVLHFAIGTRGVSRSVACRAFPCFLKGGVF